MLVLQNVSRHFKDQVAVEDVSMTLKSGTVTGLLGANGAGKSTLLKLIAGQLPTASGGIRLDDCQIKPTRASVRKQIHLIDTPRPSNASCASPIYEMLLDYGVSRETLPGEVADWFERFNLVGIYRSTTSQISKGQLYKIYLIGLFLARPKVWLLDEPFSGGLDANGLQILLSEIQQHASAGGIILFSTQWPAQAYQVVDRLIVLDRARTVWDQEKSRVPDQHKYENASPSLQAIYRSMRLAEEQVG